MVKHVVPSISFAIAAIGLVGGCDDKERPATNSTASTSATTPSRIGDGQTKGVTVDEFLANVTPTSCKALAECKSDKVRASVDLAMITVASFGVQDHPALQQRLNGALEARKKERAALANEQQCRTIGDVAMKALGLTPEALKEQIGKTVKYDGEKASACIAKLASPLPACATEVRLGSEPKSAEVRSYASELRGEMNAHIEVCDDVLVGTIGTGQPCKHHYECSGAHAKCDKNMCVERAAKPSGSQRTAKRPLATPP
jgi:hypothetical protein